MKRIFYVQSPGSEISLKKTSDYPAKTQTFENLFSFLNLLLSKSLYSLSEIIFCLKTHIPLYLFLNLPNLWGHAVTPIIPARRLLNEESKKSTHYSPTKLHTLSTWNWSRIYIAAVVHCGIFLFYLLSSGS